MPETKTGGMPRTGFEAFLHGANAALADFYKDPVVRDISAGWVDLLAKSSGTDRKTWQGLRDGMDGLGARWRNLMLEGLVEVGRTPRKLVAKRGRASLFRYSPGRRSRKNPVFMVYAMIGRPFILDLLPDISVIQRYLDEGIPVYLLEWGIPGPEDADRSLGSYLTRILDPMFEAAVKDSGRERLHLFGYCQGGVFALMFAALYPKKLRSLTLLATPVDFTPMLDLLRPWTEPGAFDASKLSSAFGNIPGELIQFSFGRLQPMRAMQSQWAFAKGVAEGAMGPEAVERHLAVERWVAEVIPHPGRAFKEFVHELGMKGLLARNLLVLDGRRVELGAIDCPLQVIVGDSDHLVPMAASEPALRWTSSKIKRLLRVPTGHVGLSIGQESHEKLWPKAARWTAAMARNRRPHRVPAAPAAGDPE